MDAGVLGLGSAVPLSDTEDLRAERCAGGTGGKAGASARDAANDELKRGMDVLRERIGVFGVGVVCIGLSDPGRAADRPGTTGVPGSLGRDGVGGAGACDGGVRDVGVILIAVTVFSPGIPDLVLSLGGVLCSAAPFVLLDIGLGCTVQ